jgi:UDP-N-acetylmuramoyl-tripeptide--D-alanyl-D-alanine ligase
MTAKNSTRGSDAVWTAKDAAAATGGRAQGAWTAAGVSIDTRSLKPGDLFIALKGENGDGHIYVQKALDAGACAVMVSGISDAKQPALVVKDTFAALQDLGRAARARTGAKIIAITGSVGKTGTKEMLAAAFGALGQTHAAKASHNNHWGVPLSLAGMHAGCDYGIFEIGMNHAGEITPLTQMVRPHLAIITTVASVHLEHFGTEEKIADAKSEIFEGMSEGGLAVLNRDNEWFAYLSAKAQARGLKVFGFGEHAEAQAKMIECLEAANGSRIKARIAGEDVSFTLRIPGRHIAVNALSVLLAVKLMNGDLIKAAAALESIQPIKGRGLRESIVLGDPANPVTLIDESYNASPTAMRAAFKVLALVDPGRGGRRIAVLGDMRELGPDGPRLHRELSLPLQAAGVNLVYTCGPLMKNLYDVLPPEKRGVHNEDNLEMAKIVPEVLAPGDVVMVKGSRGGGEKPRMQLIVEAVRALPEKLKAKTGNGH